jgi:hypothetical protein
MALGYQAIRPKKVLNCELDATCCEALIVSNDLTPTLLLNQAPPNELQHRRNANSDFLGLSLIQGQFCHISSAVQNVSFPFVGFPTT